jgi:cephalosporin-C deacetylase-like acetyl esterase
VLVVSSKLFGKSSSSPTYAEHLNGITLKHSPINGVGSYEVEADTLAGKMDPAFLVYKWMGEEYPTLIYHHGNLERPFNFHWYMKNTFRDIFMRSGQPIEANLIALRAPYHRGSYIRYARNIGHLTNFIALLSVSVRLIEDLISHFKNRTKGRVIVAGISLGGLAANLHRTYFNSADVYVPLCAGAALADVFTTSAYRKVINIVYENEQAIQEIIDFEEEFRKVKTENVFPLLARYDQLFRFERQRASYEGYPVEVVDKGHWTAALSSKALRRHILSFID